MRHFNSTLHQARLDNSLTIKELAKKIHINRFQLYLMEKGYLKPTVGQVAVLNHYFGMDFAELLVGEASYPVAIDKLEPSPKEVRVRERLSKKKTKWILFGGLIASLLIGGAGIGFVSASRTDGDASFQGAYSSVRNAVMEKGMHSRDTITGAETSTYSETYPNSEIVHLTFEQNNNLLKFNSNIFSVLDANQRYVYQFGFDMSVHSYVGSFTYGLFANAEFATCRFDLKVDGTADSVYNVNIMVDDDQKITEELLLTKLNEKLEHAIVCFSETMSDLAGKDVSFIDDFLPAREAGRIRNFRMQTGGAIMMLVGVFASTGFLLLFLNALLANAKPRLEVAELNEGKEIKRRPLPTDPSISVGLPETLIKFVGLGALLASAIIYATIFIQQFQSGVEASSRMTAWASTLMLTGVFFVHFLNFQIKSKDRSLLANLFIFIGLYLTLAGVETVLVIVAQIWGYSVQDLLIGKLPANIFGIGACHYLIMLFLFLTPKFVRKGKRWYRTLWHCLSILPLGFLILSYIMGNYEASVYGAKSNAFIHIWFPNSFIALSTVCVIYLYGVFFLRIFFAKRYGAKNANIFFTGNMFSMIRNALGASAILVVGLTDLALSGNSYFAFWGIGTNYWILLLIPFVLLHKHHVGPRNPKLDGALAVVYGLLYWASFGGVLALVIVRLL